MSAVVWKFVLPVQHTVNLDLPRDHQVLAVQEQRGELCLWALVESESPKAMRRFRIIGTGNTIHEPVVGDYVGTVQMADSWLVWHVFAEPMP